MLLGIERIVPQSQEQKSSDRPGRPSQPNFHDGKFVRRW